MSVGDKLLLQQLKEGDRAAFHELYHQYKAQIYYNLIRLLHSEDLAEELLQEVFLKVWESRTQIKLEMSFQAYLYRVSKNAAIDFYRRTAKQRLLLSKAALFTDEVYEHIEQDIDYKEVQELIHEQINKLPERRKQVYIKCRMEGLSYDQVSKELNISKGTVRDHMVKANRFIKKELTNYWSIYHLIICIAIHNL